MSKRSLFWGNASGKLGEAVYYRAGGEQRTRTWVSKIKNPKTYAQMIQRIKIANVTAAYKLLKPVCSNAFPLKKQNESGFNAFSRANIPLSEAITVREWYKEGQCVPLGFVVADGDIMINTDLTVDSDAKVNWLGLSINTKEAQAFVDTKDKKPYALASAQDIYALLSNGGQLQNNDLPGTYVITIVWALYNGEAWTPGFKYIEVSGSSTDRWHIYTNGIPSQYMPDTTLYWNYDFDDQGDIINEGFTIATEQNEASIAESAFAVIVSWTENGKQRVTRSILQGGMDEAVYKDFLPGSSTYDEILQSWGATEGSILSTK